MKLYYSRTPNGMKPIIFLLENKVDFEPIHIDLSKDEQFGESFLKVSPNNKIPALEDGDLKLFESGAILEYFADQHLDFKNDSNRYSILKWLYWQMGGFGPMLGQNHHFNRYAKEKVPYAINRYVNESKRLYGVLDQELSKNIFVGGEKFHIADMAIYPWAIYHKDQEIDLNDYPNVQRWKSMLDERPSIVETKEKFFNT